MMRKRLMISLLILGSLQAASLRAQEPDQEAVAAIKEALSELSQAIKGRITDDQIHFLKVLADRWKSANPSQRKQTFALAKRNLKSKNRPVREATVIALASMNGGKKGHDAKNATKILLKEAKSKRNKKDLPMITSCLKSVGRLKTPAGAKALSDLLHHKDNEVIAGALDSMVSYSESKFVVRRKLVEEILKTYTSTAGAARDPRNTTAKAKLGAIELQAEVVLASLTKQPDVKGAAKWQKWWNKKGKKARSW